MIIAKALQYYMDHAKRNVLEEVSQLLLSEIVGWTNGMKLVIKEVPTIISIGNISVHNIVNFNPVSQNHAPNNSTSHDIRGAVHSKIKTTEHYWYRPYVPNQRKSRGIYNKVINLVWFLYSFFDNEHQTHRNWKAN